MVFASHAKCNVAKQISNQDTCFNGVLNINVIAKITHDFKMIKIQIEVGPDPVLAPPCLTHDSSTRLFTKQASGQ